jgi:hypothetical protein
MPLAPFPSKGSPVEIQAGVLARGTHLLSAPSQGHIPQWFSQISFRLQLRGSAGLAPASLLTAPGCEVTWISSISQLLIHLTTITGALQDKFYGDVRQRATATFAFPSASTTWSARALDDTVPRGVWAYCPSIPVPNATGSRLTYTIGRWPNDSRRGARSLGHPRLHKGRER